MLDGQESSPHNNPIARKAHPLRLRTADHRSLGTQRLEFAIGVPSINPLNLEEIRAVARFGLGLRNTDPLSLDRELGNGLHGDYIILSQLDEFLKVESMMGLATTAFCKGMDAQIKGIDTLPQQFHRQLVNFIRNSTTFRMGKKSPYEEMTLRRYIDEYIPEVVPAFELIREGLVGAQVSFDTTKYTLFGKHRTRDIRPEEILEGRKLTAQELHFLRVRYKKYLSERVDTLYANNKGEEKRLADYLDSDLDLLLTRKVLAMVRASVKKK